MASDSSGKAKHRSPIYPAIDLGQAIERAEQLVNAVGRHATPIEAIADAWNYKPSSSAVLQTVSALKQFGLLTDAGSKADRTAMLTEAALDIVYGVADSQERGDAIKAAALRPRIYAELWDAYDGNPPPTDAPIAHFLIRKRNFNPASVKNVIKDFRATISFAGLDKPDTMPPNKASGQYASDEEDAMDYAAAESAHPKGGTVAPAPSGNLKDFTLYTADAKGVLYVPARMSRRDFELLKRQIDASLLVIEATSVVEERVAESQD